MENKTRQIEQIIESFKKTFGSEPDFIARAPGRINLIGEHTDYNGGFVLPAAIDRYVVIAVGKVPDKRTVEMFSLDYNNHTTFELDNIVSEPAKELHWSNYVRGVLWALAQKGFVDSAKVPGTQFVISGNVPRGAGLSSSAAIEVASALAFLKLAGTELDRKELALACQLAENQFIGVKSGIMDQFISALGEVDSALLIDTRSLENQVVPLELEKLGYKLVALYSAVPRTLGSTAYNQRRSECEQAAAILGVTQLRDINPEQFGLNEHKLPEILRKRARHVVRENARTLLAVQLMKQGFAARPGSLERLGELLYASHTSLRDDYEVSCPELDLLVNLAQQCPGVIGSRMTGAGFGGCTVNIVAEKNLPDFEKQVLEEYRRNTSLPAEMYICRAVTGGQIIV
jgi:galactokinase